MLKYAYLLSMAISVYFPFLQAETENIQMWEWDEFTSLERPHTIWGAGPIPQGCLEDRKKEEQSSSN